MKLHTVCATGVAVMGLALSQARPGVDRQLQFERVVIDADGPQAIWLKTVGDLNGDGRPDLVAGGYKGGGLVWYENPTWKKHVIAAQGAFSTDGEVADVDGDGDKDLIVLTAKELLWYENPGWTAHHIDDVVLHDIEVADLDGDGRVDIVGRDQGAFSNHHGNLLHIYRQESPSSWKQRTVEIPDGEGLVVADINRDKRPDVVIGRFWIENPGDIMSGSWPLREYGKQWDYPHVFAAVGDINGDGRPDIVLAPSEKAGGQYRISWFEAPRNPRTGVWTEHAVEDAVETVHHFIGTADFNKDGRLDIATARMAQGKSPEISVHLNEGKGERWIKQVITPTSSHSMRVVDVDGDGLPDLFGADFNGHVVELWKNATGTHTRIGMELWTYRSQLKADLPQTLAEIHRLGFTDIETASFYGRSPVDFRQVLEQAGLTCSSIITGYARLKSDLPAVIADAKGVGAKYVLTADIPHQGRLTAEAVHQAVADFNAWGAALRAAGLQFGYHPHGFEFVPAGTGNLYDLLLAETKPELVTYELDTYHFAQAGADPVHYLKKYPGRFALVHLKDMAKGAQTGVTTGKAVPEESVALGTGTLDWRAMFAAARKAGVKVYYIEDESVSAPAQVPMSVNYLKSISNWEFR